MSADQSKAERRQATRLKKNYIGRFVLKSNPSQKFEISQIENISTGGLAFTSKAQFRPNDVISIELSTPFVSSKLQVEGTILSVNEKIKGLIYQNHVKFQNVSPVTAEILKSIEHYSKGER